MHFDGLRKETSVQWHDWDVLLDIPVSMLSAFESKPPNCLGPGSRKWISQQIWLRCQQGQVASMPARQPSHMVLLQPNMLFLPRLAQGLKRIEFANVAFMWHAHRAKQKRRIDTDQQSVSSMSICHFAACLLFVSLNFFISSPCPQWASHSLTDQHNGSRYADHHSKHLKHIAQTSQI